MSLAGIHPATIVFVDIVAVIERDGGYSYEKVVRAHCDKAAGTILKYFSRSLEDDPCLNLLLDIQRDKNHPDYYINVENLR